MEEDIFDFDMVEEWLKNQGGTLEVCADGVLLKFSGERNPCIQLYTVLSVHKPNEDAAPPLPGGYQPDWGFLERALLARSVMALDSDSWQWRTKNDDDSSTFSSTSIEKDESWARTAVSEYRAFVDLKIENKDWNSEMFSPSVAIDDVWHTHISFLRRYQCDMLFLTGGKAVIEHSPLLEVDAIEKYKNAFNAHKERMEMQGKVVNSRFWPDPSDYRRKETDADFTETPERGMCAIGCG